MSRWFSSGFSLNSLLLHDCTSFVEFRCSFSPLKGKMAAQVGLLWTPLPWISCRWRSSSCRFPCPIKFPLFSAAHTFFALWCNINLWQRLTTFEAFIYVGMSTLMWVSTAASSSQYDFLFPDSTDHSLSILSQNPICAYRWISREEPDQASRHTCRISLKWSWDPADLLSNLLIPTQESPNSNVFKIFSTSVIRFGADIHPVSSLLLHDWMLRKEAHRLCRNSVFNGRMSSCRRINWRASRSWEP